MQKIPEVTISLIIFASVIGLNEGNYHAIDHNRSKRNIINPTVNQSSQSDKLPISKNTSDHCTRDCQNYTENNFHMESSCINAYFSGKKCTFMVNKCPTNFYDRQIAYHCETVNEVDLSLDFRLSVPVTNAEKNITYKNVFCAYCNGERRYKFWDVSLLCKPKIENFNEDTGNLILQNLSMSEDRQMLISNVNQTTFKCLIQGRLENTSNLRSSIHQCKRNYAEFNTTTYNPSIGPIPFNHNNLFKFFNYKRTNGFIVDGKIYFQFKVLTQGSPEQREYFFPAADREICANHVDVNEKSEVHYIDNETINVTVDDQNLTFGPNEWCHTFIRDQIYVCYTSRKQSDVVRNFLILSILRAFSVIFFLALITAIITNPRKKQSLPNKVIVCYGITVLAWQLLTNVSFFVSSCKVMGPLLYYLSLSYYIWVLILAYEFWRMVRFSINLVDKIARQPHSKKFLLYCVLGWIAPFSILSVVVYLESVAECGDVTSCELRPTFGKYLTCRMTGLTAISYFHSYPIIVTSFLIVIAFLNSAYNIYLMNKLNYIQTTSKNENVVILIKLACTLGVGFIILLFSYFIDDTTGRAALNVFEQSQGVILYFIHGYDKENISATYKYILRKRNSPKNINNSAPKDNESSTLTSF